MNREAIKQDFWGGIKVDGNKLYVSEQEVTKKSK
jgi:hypothetical protein